MTESQAIDAYYNKKTKVVGRCEPCREMKWTGWVVIEVDGEMWACIVDRDGDCSGADKIDPTTLDLYIDEPEDEDDDEA